MRGGKRSRSLRAGVSDPQSRCAEKAIHLSALTPSQNGKNDKFKSNLIKKRKTYHRYFERNLSTIDDKLRKIVLARDIKCAASAARAAVVDSVEGVFRPGLRPWKLHPKVEEAAAAAKLAEQRCDESLNKLTKKSKKYVERCASTFVLRREVTQKRLATKNLNAKERRRLAHIDAQEAWAMRNRSFGHLPSVCSLPPRLCRRKECIDHWLSVGYVERDGEWVKTQPARKAPLKRSNAMRGKGKRGKGK